MHAVEVIYDIICQETVKESTNKTLHSVCTHFFSNKEPSRRIVSASSAWTLTTNCASAIKRQWKSTCERWSTSDSPPQSVRTSTYVLLQSSVWTTRIPLKRTRQCRLNSEIWWHLTHFSLKFHTKHFRSVNQWTPSSIACCKTTTGNCALKQCKQKWNCSMHCRPHAMWRSYHQSPVRRKEAMLKDNSCRLHQTHLW